VHGVPGAAQLVSEHDEPGGQSLRVVEEHHLSHLYLRITVRLRGGGAGKQSFLLRPSFLSGAEPCRVEAWMRRW
jgi:hypothetical protein